MDTLQQIDDDITATPVETPAQRRTAAMTALTARMDTQDADIEDEDDEEMTPPDGNA
jgi:hypothetical protein